MRNAHLASALAFKVISAFLALRTLDERYASNVFRLIAHHCSGAAEKKKPKARRKAKRR
jgi:hypothetical protein